HSHGHERIGLLSPPPSVRAGKEVTSAFLSAVDCEELVCHGPLTQEFGYAAARDLLERAEPPTALVIAGTQVLVGVLTALESLGLRVPRDVSLISYDDSAAAKFHSPPISTLTRDCERIGELAARMVLERIEHRRQDLRKVFVPTVYVRRGSVTRPRTRGRTPARDAR